MAQLYNYIQMDIGKNVWPVGETEGTKIEHGGKLIDKGEARQYVADLLNVGRSTLSLSFNA